MRYKLGIATLFNKICGGMPRVAVNQNSLQYGISVNRPSWGFSEGAATSGWGGMPYRGLFYFVCRTEGLLSLFKK
jgi:hypothetical protein